MKEAAVTLGSGLFFGFDGIMFRALENVTGLPQAPIWLFSMGAVISLRLVKGCFSVKSSNYRKISFLLFGHLSL